MVRFMLVDCLRRGQSGFAVLGVNPQETQSSIDAALTFGILWLDACRLAQAGKMVVEGLKLFLPAGASALTRERMAHLHQDAAKWQLYELENRDDHLKEIEVSDGGNVRTRLVHWTDEAEAGERFAEAIERVRELMPEAEMAVISPAEIAFRCHGLEFAKARLAHQLGSLRSTPEIVFGVGADERVLVEAERSCLPPPGAQRGRSAPCRGSARSCAVAAASRTLAGIAGGAGRDRSGRASRCLDACIPRCRHFPLRTAP